MNLLFSTVPLKPLVNLAKPKSKPSNPGGDVEGHDHDVNTDIEQS